ncbi:AAA family ATPase [Brevibacterium otitidis]|uniref:AAA family ATPase n=1 Tax=Brevibacterium otitidis TaxID=53364 RepID=A0ABV5X1S1_9MICO|nr:AAA family ATPase [Brevibacterium otitidis]
MNDLPRTQPSSPATPDSTPNFTPEELRDFASRFTAFVDAMAECSTAGDPAAPSFRTLLSDHLGGPAEQFEAVAKRFPIWRYADLDIAIEAVLGDDRTIHGINTSEASYDFTELIANRYEGFAPGAVQYESVPTDPKARRRVAAEAVSLFVRDGQPMALLQARTGEFGEPVSYVSILAGGDAAAEAVLTEIAEAMNARSALRGQVVTFGGGAFGEAAQAVQFHPRPQIAADQVILPADSLERIRRHVLGISEMAERLQAAGQHLKRGILLYGPPGTGKTHTVRHLIGLSVGTTVIMLSGESLEAISLAAETARALQPAIVVLEDCDLVAESRDFSEGTRPLLFEVLDALDGLAGDADVAFVLTTNRAEALEEALVQRPGRIDLAVEIPRPDTSARRALFELYSQQLSFSPAALDEAAERTAGVTASFVKEAVRRSVVLAALDGRDADDASLLAAVAELRGDEERLTASLLASGGVDEGLGAGIEDFDGSAGADEFAGGATDFGTAGS